MQRVNLRFPILCTWQSTFHSIISFLYFSLLFTKSVLCFRGAISALGFFDTLRRLLWSWEPISEHINRAPPPPPPYTLSKVYSLTAALNIQHSPVPFVKSCHIYQGLIQGGEMGCTNNALAFFCHFSKNAKKNVLKVLLRMGGGGGGGGCQPVLPSLPSVSILTMSLSAHMWSPTLCTIAQATPTPMHYCTSQPHPYALLHKPAPPLCTIAQASPAHPMHYYTSQPHPYALLHKPHPYALLHKPHPMHYCTSQPHPMHYCTSQPHPMHYCTSQPHPYALLHKPAPPLCTITQARPTPMHYCTSQPHPYALLHKPAPPYALLHKPAPPYALLHKPAPPLCTIAQARPIPRHCCTNQPHPYRAGGHRSFSRHFTDMADQTATYKVTMSCHINTNKFFTLTPHTTPISTSACRHA